MNRYRNSVPFYGRLKAVMVSLIHKRNSVMVSPWESRNGFGHKRNSVMVSLKEYGILPFSGGGAYTGKKRHLEISGAKRYRRVSNGGRGKCWRRAESTCCPSFGQSSGF